MRPIDALLCLALLLASPARAEDSSVDAAGTFGLDRTASLLARPTAPLAATYASDSCGRWDDQFGLRGVNGTVRAAVRIGTDLYVAGIGINQAGGTRVSNIAKWDGTSWTSIGGTTGQLYCLATDGTNLYVGGSFSNIGGVAAENLARWNGSSWSRMWTTNNGSVEALAVRGTDLYAGGNFTSVNGNVAASRIARWNGSTWSTVGAGGNHGLVLRARVGWLHALCRGNLHRARHGARQLHRQVGRHVVVAPGRRAQQPRPCAVRERHRRLRGRRVHDGRRRHGEQDRQVERIELVGARQRRLDQLGRGPRDVRRQSLRGRIVRLAWVAWPRRTSRAGIGAAWSAVGSPALALLGSRNLYDLLVVPGAGGDELLAGGIFESIGGVASRGVACPGTAPRGRPWIKATA